MKHPVQSRTVWLNTLIVVTGVSSYLAGNEVIVNYPRAVATLLIIQGLSNIALRFITKTGLDYGKRTENPA
jgi:hypothetical protein